MSDIDFRLLQGAIAVAEELNMSRAAEHLGITQPALTKRMHDLEQRPVWRYSSNTLRKLVEAHKPVLLTPLGNDTVLRKSIADARVVAGDWWTEHALLPELQAAIVPADHWSSRSAFDRRMALWGGLVLKAAGTTVYCAGDTGFADGGVFKEIAARFPQIDLALLPIGAYDPRWFMQAQHADPEDALKIADIVQARAALGIHWGTFHLTDEPWDEPARCFLEGVVRRGWDARRFLPLQAGDTWSAMP